jgi:SAM-dependent methyltransferase
MKYEEFLTYVNSFDKNNNFTFGTNWIDYVNKTLNASIVMTHQNDLQANLTAAGISIQNAKVFDIGCGSGLSSLSFLNLGAQSVYSIDVDEKSIEATNITKRNFANNSANWTIEKRSIFSPPKEKFSLVYSWGVLHHTGHLWRAVRNAAECVAPNGYIYLALYVSGPLFPFHLIQKQNFFRAGREEKLKILYSYLGGSVDMFNIDNRGMNRFHDAIDWLGGLPYEVCSPTQLIDFLPNFRLLSLVNGAEGGNFIATMQRVND